MDGTTRTVSLDAAAAIMGISKEALRKRIQRGTIDAAKDAAGHWQVRLSEQDRTAGQDTGQDMTGRVQAMQDEIIFLRKELERKDQLMAMLMQRVPQIEEPKQRSGFFDLFKRKTKE